MKGQNGAVMLYQRIRCFLEVARCRSFSLAGQHLFISQQAVTKQIAALEAELGFKLFHRTTRQVELTPAGSLLRDDFTQINRQIADSIRRARELDASGRTILRIGFLSALSRRDIILPIMEFLTAEYPDLELDIRLLDFVALRDQLLDGHLELCVTTSNDWQLWPGVRPTVLRRKQFQAVYAARHPLARCEPVTLESLGEHTQLVLPQDILLAGFEQWARKIPYRSVIRCPDISTLMVRLALGEGFALLTKVIDYHDSPDLRYWDIPFPEAHAEIVCICRENEPAEIHRLIQNIRRRELIRL